jgi:hypothetical protein
MGRESARLPNAAAGPNFMPMGTAVTRQMNASRLTTAVAASTVK